MNFKDYCENVLNEGYKISFQNPNVKEGDIIRIEWQGKGTNKSNKIAQVRQVLKNTDKIEIRYKPVYESDLIKKYHIQDNEESGHGSVGLYQKEPNYPHIVTILGHEKLRGVGPSWTPKPGNKDYDLMH